MWAHGLPGPSPTPDAAQLRWAACAGVVGGTIDGVSVDFKSRGW